MKPPTHRLRNRRAGHPLNVKESCTTTTATTTTTQSLGYAALDELNVHFAAHFNPTSRIPPPQALRILLSTEIPLQKVLFFPPSRIANVLVAGVVGGATLPPPPPPRAPTLLLLQTVNKIAAVASPWRGPRVC